MPAILENLRHQNQEPLDENAKENGGTKQQHKRLRLSIENEKLNFSMAIDKSTEN